MIQQRTKTGGRELGTPNKVTKELKEVLSEVVNNELANVKELLSTLTPKERLDVVIKLLPYITPKLKETTLEVDNVEQPLFLSREEREEHLEQLFKKWQSSKKQP